MPGAPRERRVLLISSSTIHGSGYLDHAEGEIRDFLGGVRRVLFVPYAILDMDGYAAKVQARFRDLGHEVESIHTLRDPRQAVKEAEALFVGGGNTWRLLDELYTHDLLEPIRWRTDEGMPYVGSSAGSNVAAPTIKTTNDMPILEPPSFEALGLVTFQINPHYLDPDPASTHMGETREERIQQFLEENPTPVVGLREGSIARVEGGSTSLRGVAPARIFRRGHAPAEVQPGSSLDPFLGGEA
jgi:dipeptidase E